MTAKRGPSGSRLRLALAVGLTASLLASCAEISRRVGNYTGGIPALPASEGWAELPVGRWLQESGVTVTAMSFCRPEQCARPGFAARLRFDGRERTVIRQIAERPETLTGRPTARSARELAARRQQPRGRSEVSRLAIGDWAGGLYVLHPASEHGRSAHVVILARPSDSSAMIAVADEGDTALAIANAAIWW